MPGGKPYLAMFVFTQNKEDHIEFAEQCRSAADSDDDLFSSPPKIAKTRISRTRPKQQKSPAATVKKKAPEPDSPTASKDSGAEDISLAVRALHKEGTPVPQATSVQETGAVIPQAMSEFVEAPAPQQASLTAQELNEGVGDGLELISGNINSLRLMTACFLSVYSPKKINDILPGHVSS